jgi:prevent-host-death family protein
MGKVTRTELNQQTARVLARVAEGERITITDRGRPVAEVVPLSRSRRDELVASGRLVPPTARGPLRFAPVKLDVSSQEILDDLRADRS